MFKSIFFCFFSQAVFANSNFEILSFKAIDANFKAQNQLVGGLSAALKLSENEFVFVSDDRGEHGQPRWFKAQINLSLKNELEISNWQVQTIDFSKSATQKKVKNKFRKVDLEGIAVLPWGNFLLSNEGDYNFFPRSNPSFIEVKPTGEFAKEYFPPDRYLPDKKAKLTKGIRNNLGFEGLSFCKENNFWIVATEAQLKQEEKLNFVRFLQIKSEMAWNLSFGKEWKYPIDTHHSFRNGVSEVFCNNKNKLWVLERAVSLEGLSLHSDLKLFEVDLDKVGSDQTLVKKLIWDMSKIFKDEKWKNSLLSNTIMNIEGIAEGPNLKDGSKTLLFVTDNNFFKTIPTIILLVKVK